MNYYRNFFIVLILGLSLSSCGIFKPSNQGKHLFILSGQSNMVHLDPSQSFIPTLENEFGTENIIVVKDAKGTQPISRWYKKAKPNPKEQNIADLYDRLFNKVKDAIQNEKLQSVTFIWMQGERDAKLANAEVYEDYLLGLYHQLSDDLNRKDVNFIIGRLNDFDMNNEKWPHWSLIREIQVKVGDSNTRFSWINTDDLNHGLNNEGKSIKNDLHMSLEGYKVLGKRFADKAILLINKSEN